MIEASSVGIILFESVNSTAPLDGTPSCPTPSLIKELNSLKNIFFDNVDSYYAY